MNEREIQKAYDSFLNVMKAKLGKDTNEYKSYCDFYKQDFEAGLQVARRKEKISIEGDRILIREINLEDVPFCGKVECEVSNAPYVAHWPDGLRIAMLGNPDLMQFIITDKKQTSLGLLIFKNMLHKEEKVELKRIVLTEKDKGYGKEALYLAQKLAFEVFETQCLYLTTKPENTRAQAIYQKTGFEADMPEPCTSYHLDREAYYKRKR